MLDTSTPFITEIFFVVVAAILVAEAVKVTVRAIFKALKPGER